MSSLELRIPPDVVWLAVAGLMWLASQMTAGGLGAVEPARRPLAVLLIVIGIALIVAARVELNRAGTTWHPTEPGRSTALVTSGVYRLSRNPTYLGMEIVLIGWAVLLASPVAVLVSALFVVYIGRFQIRPEESTLSVSLGQEYGDYSERVRRWV
ncbi:MAG: isoprenylcysteine carboxylmethyltransferase family protein [Actinobacteria bacterium]|nr:isoprenylcysteine carboxylmethyltransferase family protein [Actinomycetota bacterium]